MMIKYRVHEVAKDLEINSKVLIDFLATRFEEPKKHMTALTEEELNVIFEYFTNKYAVKSFDEYFAVTAQKPEQPKPEAKEEPVQQKQAPKPSTPAAAPKAAESKPLQKQQEQAPVTPQQPAVSQKPQGQKPAQNKPSAQQQPGKPAQQLAKPAQQPAKPAQQAAKPAQQRTQKKPKEKFQNVLKPTASAVAPAVATATKNVRRVDTRASFVELDKYNEKYERIAPTTLLNNDSVQRKQKLTQRSAQKGKPMSSKKESETEKLRRLQFMQQLKKHQLRVTIPDQIVVSELASRLKVTAAEVVKRLMALGVMASVSQTVDYDTAAMVAIELGAKVEKEVVVTIEERLIDDSTDSEENLDPRSPVVVVMGHVDHGKTSLLDAIRNAQVTATEAGGITQHIGAYKVRVNDKDITFLDTPGHEAFTAMRARGAQVTDIAILVVAADDGIKPQTVEAINHAKAAGVSIIVAINKMDKPEANAERVKQELTEYELVPEEWGGDIICVPVSAKTHQNIDTLLEMILLVAEVKELKANPNRLAKGVVIEAKLDKGKGPVATVLVQNGTLKSGDIIIAGTSVGRVRAMTDENGRKLQTAGPSTPVEVIGLAEVPSAGDVFNAVEDERLARELVEQRKQYAKEEQFNAYQKVTLDNLFSQIAQGEMKELAIIVKADVQGSVEAVKQSLEKLTNEEVRVRVIHGGVGSINESDVMLADASNAIIVGFNVRPDAMAKESADDKGVDLRMYRIIYDCIEEIKSAMKGMLAPKYREVDLGRVEVRQVYKLSSVGTIAGCYVLSGKVTRNAKIRVVRDGIVISVDEISSLKRFKDDVKEVAASYECGIALEKFNDIKEGDIFEPYIIEEYRD